VAAALQALAIHVGVLLETRCLVHRLLFDRLISAAGSEAAAAAAPHPTTVPASGQPSIVIHNNISPSLAAVASPDVRVAAAAGREGSAGVGAAAVALGAALGAGLQWLLSALGFLRDVVVQVLALRAAYSALQAAKAVAPGSRTAVESAQAQGQAGQQQHHQGRGQPQLRLGQQQQQQEAGLPQPQQQQGQPGQGKPEADPWGGWAGAALQ
jgi:hypothetical protein